MEERVTQILGEMSLAEKIGQMCQVHADIDDAPGRLGDALRQGRIGSVINQVDPGVVAELQRIAVDESRLGIPLLVGRDVIHGFRTILPIPLGQAASWNPELVAAGASMAAREAAVAGINWTFAPMLDVSRDPRWGRIAESFGEDPCLTARLGAAAVRGLQHPAPSGSARLAACAKHFAGYGACEGGRDYAATNVPENELRNIHLQPFKAAVDAGVMTLMSSFSEIDGIPSSANGHLLREILRDEWAFDGFVVSDWDSIRQLSIHGLTADDRESALEAVIAGLDMEMAGDAYFRHLAGLLESGRIDDALIDDAVSNILRIKLRLGLFEPGWRRRSVGTAESIEEDARETARLAALQSVVLLSNRSAALPLSRERLSSLAVIGPLADAAHEQLGTWVFDGDPNLVITPLEGLRQLLGDSVTIRYLPAMESSRSRDTSGFDEAVALATESDAVVVFLGEESILSGEAHCRADIGLPGAQKELVCRLAETGRSIVAVIMAGRPLVLTDVVEHLDAILFAWHPGALGGLAIADLLFGVDSPSGKLPATLPRSVGQVPIYYNHKNTGKPPAPDSVVHIDDIEAGAPQTSLGMTSFYLDAGYTPLFPFGHGLSYTAFTYSRLRVEPQVVEPGTSVTVSAELTNSGDVAATEVVQCYVRDLVGNVTRPVRELKDFRRIRLEPGETATVVFTLRATDLAFYGRDNTLRLEAGDFHVWIGGSSATDLRGEFTLAAEH